MAVWFVWVYWKSVDAMKKDPLQKFQLHISSPDSAINLSLSLDGFTAAFDIIEPFKTFVKTNYRFCRLTFGGGRFFPIKP